MSVEPTRKILMDLQTSLNASLQRAIDSLAAVEVTPAFLEKQVFFDAYRAEFGRIKPAQVGPIEWLLDRLVLEPLLLQEMAYILATVKHETNATYLPVREAYWLSEAWRRGNLPYWPWYGRGFVQLTHQDNYAKAGEKLRLDFTTDPDAVMQLDVSYQILVRGMTEGWFRQTHRLSRYISRDRADYLGARAIVNGRVAGVDERIAADAMRLQACLERAVAAQRTGEREAAPA